MKRKGRDFPFTTLLSGHATSRVLSPTAGTVPQVQLTDLPMIKEGRAQKLRAAGIETVAQLAAVNLAELAKHPVFEADDGFVGQLHILQGYAEAHAKGAAVVHAADERLWDLPKPIIHMDLEFDGPAYEIFLYGFQDHDSGKTWQWFDHTKSGQTQLLKDFRDYVKNENPTIVTWGGNASDMVQLRRACEKNKLDTAWLKKMSWLDLQTDVVFTGNPETQRIYLPVRNFSSDTVAKFFGYEKPRLRIKDGYSALKLYQAYKRHPRPGIKADLCDYNIEDCKHTRLILDGVRALMEPYR